MYEKVMTEMFEGSLYGKGWGPLLVMSYALSNWRPDKEVGMQVDLNPRALADKFGELETDVVEAIEFLCNFETPRLERLGVFTYRIVHGAEFRSMQVEEERRERARLGMRKVRQSRASTPNPKTK